MTQTQRQTGAQASAPPGEDTILFGGSGFLGQAILAQYPQVISVGRTAPATANRHIAVESLADLDALREIHFSKVIYTVGNSDRPGMVREVTPRGQPTPFDHHLTPLLQTLEQLKQYPIKKFIHFSTVLLYDGEKITLPVSERAPINPYQNRYVLSKHLAEEVCKYYGQRIPIINIRLSNLYGPSTRQRFDLIYSLICQILAEGQAQVLNTKTGRDFLYVEDAAPAIMKLLDSDYTGTLNLGSGTMTPIRRIVEILQAVSGCPIIDLAQPVQGLHQFQCDLRTLERVIDWSPKHSIEQGIRRTYEQMKRWRAA